MLKNYISLFVLFHFGMVALKAKEKEPVDYFNTLQGTDFKYELTRGNTYPTTALPFGMHTWRPQTGKKSDRWNDVYFSMTSPIL